MYLEGEGRRSFGCHKLQTSHLNLIDLQANGTRHSRYLRQVWGMNKWLYKGQHGIRTGYSCESRIVTVCQDIADTLDDGTRMEATIIDSSKAYSLVPYDCLLMKMAASGMDSSVVIWVREFLLGNLHRVKVGGQLSEEVRAMSRERIGPASIP